MKNATPNFMYCPDLDWYWKFGIELTWVLALRDQLLKTVSLRALSKQMFMQKSQLDHFVLDDVGFNLL